MHNCPKIPRVRCVQVSQKSASAVCAGTPPNSLRNELINYLWCLTSRKRQRPFSLIPPPQSRSLLRSRSARLPQSPLGLWAHAIPKVPAESAAGDLVGSAPRQEELEAESGRGCGHHALSSPPENMDKLAAKTASAVAKGASSFPVCGERPFAVTAVGLPSGPFVARSCLTQKG